MIKKSLFIWIFLIVFGFSSMPDFSYSNIIKQTGKTEVGNKKKSKKKSSRKTQRKKSSKKKSSKKKYSKRKKGSKNKRSAGKKKYSKKKHYGKKSRYGKKHRRNRKVSYRHKYYAPPTNSNSVEYRNYKRNDNSEPNIENIAPQKEIRKEPKKEGE